MGQDPDRIREEIGQTRAEIGETLEAVAHRADVKGRTRESVAGKVDAVKGKVGESASRVEGTTRQGAQRLSTTVQENPLGFALGGVAVGFLAGLVVPSTQVEEEKLGPAADELRDEARKTGREALERGKGVAEQALRSAADTATEQGRRQGQELADHAKQGGREVGSRITS